jgi:ZIP family zinc transporter
VGFVFFFLAERALVLHHRDDDRQVHAHAQVGALGAAGLSLHSFIDGLGIGLAFGLDTETGLLVFLAVVAHDFADGLNTVGFVLRQSGDRARAIRWLVVDALAPLAGAVVGYLLSVSEESLGQLLAVYAGFFLFMGATDLLPHAHEHPSGRRVLLTVAGFAGIFAVSLIGGH